MTFESDTGHYKHAGEIWHVVQREDGGVECNSEKYRTSANKETWLRWKGSHGWERNE